MKRRTISLPDDLFDLVASEARRRQTSVSEVIRTFIVEGLAGTDAKPREIENQGNRVVLGSTRQLPETTLEDLVGCTEYKGPARSLDEMEAGVGEGTRKPRRYLK